jgi:hypothetical protein
MRASSPPGAPWRGLGDRTALDPDGSTTAIQAGLDTPR